MKKAVCYIQHASLVIIAAAIILADKLNPYLLLPVWLVALTVFSLTYLPITYFAGIVMSATLLFIGERYRPQIPVIFPLLTLAGTIGAWGLILMLLLTIPRRIHQRWQKHTQQYPQ